MVRLNRTASITATLKLKCFSVTFILIHLLWKRVKPAYLTVGYGFVALISLQWTRDAPWRAHYKSQYLWFTFCHLTNISMFGKLTYSLLHDLCGANAPLVWPVTVLHTVCLVAVYNSLWNIVSFAEIHMRTWGYTHLLLYVLYVIIWLFIYLFIPASYLLVQHLWRIWRLSIHWCKM